MQLHVVFDALLFGVLSFGVENGFGIEIGSFIDDLISTNLFTFGPSVGWKPVKNMLANDIVCRRHFSICKTE